MMNRRSFVAVALVFALATAPVAAQAAGPAQPKVKVPTQPLVQLTKLHVNSIDLVNGQLVANATATLKVLGETVRRAIQIPLTLGGSPGADCDILNLSLGPINLNLLGLVVNLDDCNNGPITVDITGDDSGLLGQLLCGLAGGLLGNIDLGTLLGGLNPADLLTLTDGLTDILNGLFRQILDAPLTSVGGVAPDGSCSILNLQIPDGLHLSLLGLNVDTSAICLTITAQQGQSNLLGNLLCNLLGGGNILNLNQILRNILRGL